MQIEDDGGARGSVPRAARQVYMVMGDDVSGSRPESQAML